MTEKLSPGLAETITDELQRRADNAGDWEIRMAFISAIGIVRKHVASASK